MSRSPDTSTGKDDHGMADADAPLLAQASPMRKLGDLEARVMQVVWSKDDAVSVREVREEVDPALHYNTVLTIMERLERKGVLGRRRFGRAHVYYATLSQEAFARSVTGGMLRGLLEELGDDAIAAFVDLLEEASPDALARLEQLIQERGSGEATDERNVQPKVRDDG